MSPEQGNNYDEVIKGYAISNYSKVEARLQHALLEETELRQNSPEVSRPFTISNDLFSNPFCHIWRDNTHELGFLPEQVCIFKVYLQSGKEISWHCAFNIGTYIIDPTFGQFIDLDMVQSLCPELFIGRILVADIEEIFLKTGIRYVFK